MQYNSPGSDFLSSGTSCTHLHGPETSKMEVAGRDSHGNCEDHRACADKYAEVALNRNGCLASCVCKECKWFLSKDDLTEAEQEQNQQSIPESLVKRQRDDTQFDPHFIKGSRRVTHPCSPPYVGLRMWFSFCVSRREYSTVCVGQDSDQVNNWAPIDGRCNANESCKMSSHRNPAGSAYCVPHQNLPITATEKGSPGGAQGDHDDGGRRLTWQILNAEGSSQSGIKKPILKTLTRRQPDSSKEVLHLTKRNHRVTHPCDPSHANMIKWSIRCTPDTSIRAYRVYCVNLNGLQVLGQAFIDGHCRENELCIESPPHHRATLYQLPGRAAYCIPHHNFMKLVMKGQRPHGGAGGTQDGDHNIRPPNGVETQAVLKGLVKREPDTAYILPRNPHSRQIIHQCDPPFVGMRMLSSYCHHDSTHADRILCYTPRPGSHGTLKTIRGHCKSSEICTDGSANYVMHQYIRTAYCVPSSMSMYGGGKELAGKLLRSGEVVHAIIKCTVQNRPVPGKCIHRFVGMKPSKKRIPGIIDDDGGGNESSGKLLESKKVSHSISKRSRPTCPPPYVHMISVGSRCLLDHSRRAYRIYCASMVHIDDSMAHIDGHCQDDEICVDSRTLLLTAHCVSHHNFFGLIVRGRRLRQHS